MVCQGCLNNIPNQLAHMNYGGCLYEGDVYEGEDILTENYSSSDNQLFKTDETPTSEDFSETTTIKLE